jgi:superfamily II DNA or RNA helicase
MVYRSMIKFKIISPTIAEIYDYQQDIETLRKELSYKNLSAMFLYNKHKAKDWLRRRDPEGFEEEEKRLQSEIFQSLLFNKNGKLCTYPGIIPYLNIPHSVENLIEYSAFKPIPWAKPLPFEPYDFQNKIVENLMKNPHSSISAATGLGKSLCLLMLARNAGLPTVITTPSKSIFKDLLSLLEKHLGKGKVGAFGDSKKDTSKLVTVAINKSLSMVKEGTKEWEFFRKKKILIIDEVHQFGSEDLSKTCFSVLGEILYRWHLTATPTRGDGTQKLLNAIIGECVFNMDLKEGIKRGYLSPLKFKIIPTISPSTAYIADPIECKRHHFLRNPNIATLSAKIANANWNVKKENTLILIEEMQQIEMIAKQLTVPYTYVHSGSKKDAELYGLKKVDSTEEIERFNKGEVAVIIGSRSISTGTNIFSHHTINCMAGSSEVATLQGAVGRSTRQTNKSEYAQYHKPKHFCVIYDFHVQGQQILEKQLKKRISFYEETGESVVY